MKTLIEMVCVIIIYLFARWISSFLPEHMGVIYFLSGVFYASLKIIIIDEWWL